MDDEPKYPIPGFPRITPRSIEDWVLIEDAWHHLVYVFRSGFPSAELYVDGEPLAGRAHYAFYDRALTHEEIQRHYVSGDTEGVP